MRVNFHAIGRGFETVCVCGAQRGYQPQYQGKQDVIRKLKKPM